MIYPLVRELATTDTPIRVPVAVTCWVLKIAKQPFYRWLKEPIAMREWDDAHLINAAIDIHRDDPVLGYRFIAGELEDLGFVASARRVWLLCPQQRLLSVFAKKKGWTSRKQGPPVHEGLVQPKFTATCANQLWLTDIT